MPKAVIRLGYTDYLVDVDKAMEMAMILSEAPQYKTRGYGDTTSFHIWHDGTKEVNITVVSDDVVRIGTMAGKPEA